MENGRNLIRYGSVGLVVLKNEQNSGIQLLALWREKDPAFFHAGDQSTSPVTMNEFPNHDCKLKDRSGQPPKILFPVQ